MADLEKINVDGTTLNIVDRTARNNITNEINNRMQSDNTIQSNINTIQSNINTIQSNINNIPITTLATQKINALLVGDSYGTTWEPDGTTSKTWQTYLNEIAKFRQHHEIGIGGIGLTTGLNTFQSNIENYAKTLTEADRNDINLIIVAGGANDISATSQNINKGANQLKTVCSTYFPNAIVALSCIACARIGHITDSNWINRMTNINLHTLRQYYKNASILAGLTYYENGHHCINTVEDISTDGVHPSDRGKQVIAYALFASINNYNYYGINYSTDYIYQDISTNSESLHIKTTVGTNLYKTTNSKVTLMTFDCPALAGSLYYSGNFFAVLEMEDGTFYGSSVQYLYEDNSLFLYANLVNDDHTNFLNKKIKAIQPYELYIPINR